MGSELPSPRCVFFTGPNGPGKIAWSEQRVAQLRRESPAARVAVLVAGEGLTRTERFAACGSDVAVRCVFMPCLCCPGSADLPGVARKFAASHAATHVFIEVPVLAAAGLLAEFDARLGWSRECVVWLNRAWATARRSGTLSPFQARLLGLADQVEDQPAPAPRRGDMDTSRPVLVLG